MAFDWKATLRVVAPTVASVFGTPVMGLGVKYLLDGLLLPDEVPNTPEAQEAKLAAVLQSATPELMLKIKERDQAFQLEMRKLDIQASVNETQDRDSARKLAAVDSEHVAAKLTYFVAGSFAATLVCIGILAYAQPNASPSPYIAGLVGTIVGAVISEFKQMTAFHFGKNSSSARTQEMLYQSTPKDVSGKS